MDKPFVSFYKKKPVEVSAVQFTTNNEAGGSPQMDRIVEWINSSEPDYYPRLDCDRAIARHDGTDIYIRTLEGEMRASVGDWIIRGIKGEFYPCRSDIFDASYTINPGGTEEPQDADK